MIKILTEPIGALVDPLLDRAETFEGQNLHPIYNGVNDAKKD